MPAQRKAFFVIILFCIVVSLAAFGRIAGNDFINFDDDTYITDNHHIKSGMTPKSIQWAFTEVVAGNWHPFAMLSHILDWSLFGANPSGHHLVSLFLHIGAVIFLFLFLKKTTNNIWSSALAAVFFAIHPLRVESVAWAAERKDVLSMFFGMASIYAYSLYAEKNRQSPYLICLILFVCSLMSKPMLVTMPFILLLLDHWPLGRWQKALNERHKRFNYMGRLVLEKIPFILLTIIYSLITLWAQEKSGATRFGEWLPFMMRLANALISYVEYLGKIFLPANLAVFYPYALSFPLWQVIASIVMLISITVAVLYCIKKLPFLFTGWFWFIGTLIPVIGLVQVGMQAMADRYTYLPSIGIGIMLAWTIPFLLQKGYIRKKVLLPTGLVTIAILASFTWRQCGYWKNSFELWDHALKVTKNNYLAHRYFGLALYEKGKTQEAIDHLNMAILIRPDFVEAFHNRGNAYAKIDRYQRAIADYNEAIRLKPDFAEAYISRGLIYSKLGQSQLMFKDFTVAILLQPNNAEIYHKRGYQYARLGQYQLAINDYNKAILISSDYADAYIERGITYGELGSYQLAIADFNKAILLNPRNAEAHNNRGFTYFKIGRNELAVNDYNEAIHLKPDYATAYTNRGIIHVMQANKNLGCHDFKKACGFGNCKAFESAKKNGFCR